MRLVAFPFSIGLPGVLGVSGVPESWESRESRESQTVNCTIAADRCRTHRQSFFASAACLLGDSNGCTLYTVQKEQNGGQQGDGHHDEEHHTRARSSRQQENIPRLFAASKPGPAVSRNINCNQRGVHELLCLHLLHHFTLSSELNPRTIYFSSC